MKLECHGHRFEASLVLPMDFLDSLYIYIYIIYIYILFVFSRIVFVWFGN